MSDDDELLAAELALGLLDATERPAAEARADRDDAFAAAVARWQARGAALVAALAEAPPPSLWGTVAARLPGNDTVPAHVAPAARGWKFATLGATAAALVLGVVAIQHRPAPVVPPPPAAPVTAPMPLVAVLTGKDSKAAVGISFDPALQRLVISSTTLSPGARSLQLWIIAPKHDPRSLGVIPRSASSRRAAGDVAELITAGATLAISIEPQGGSPTGQPTGPVVLNGVVEAI